jgi:hypothetical protein
VVSVVAIAAPLLRLRPRLRRPPLLMPPDISLDVFALPDASMFALPDMSLDVFAVSDVVDMLAFDMSPDVFALLLALRLLGLRLRR